MPKFNILLAHDVSYYGNVSVEANTWSEAVASLTDADWGDNCTNSGDAWEERVVHVEAEDGEILAEDINYRMEMIHSASVIQRLREIQIAAGRVPCMVMDAALDQYIEELRTMVRDPIFKKESN